MENCTYTHTIPNSRHQKMLRFHPVPFYCPFHPVQFHSVFFPFLAVPFRSVLSVSARSVRARLEARLGRVLTAPCAYTSIYTQDLCLTGFIGACRGAWIKGKTGRTDGTEHHFFCPLWNETETERERSFFFDAYCIYDLHYRYVHMRLDLHTW